MPIARHFTFLCSEVWPSEEAIKKIDKVPFLFLSSQKDELVPPDHMKQLFHLARMPVKQFAKIAAGTHNDACVHKPYWDQLVAFWNRHVE